MPAIVMSGAPVAETVLASVAVAVERLAAEGKTVGLGTILVGDDPRQRPLRSPQARGVRAFRDRFVRPPHTGHRQTEGPARRPSTSSMTTAPSMVSSSRTRSRPALTTPRRSPASDPAKDVDGLHPVNLGYLALGERGHPRPCTPLGIQAMLKYYGVPVEGRSVVIVGRGPTLGRPLALLLSLERTWRQRRGHGSAHGGQGLGRVHPAGGHCGRCRRRTQHDHARSHRPRLVRHGRWLDLGGQKGHF